jgi:hypothetical protein
MALSIAPLGAKQPVGDHVPPIAKPPRAVWLENLVSNEPKKSAEPEKKDEEFRPAMTDG